MNKRRIYRAIGCLLLVIVLLAAGIPVIPAQAAHENTYTNTGNQRQDLIGVALTQVGYREGWNNDTKYGAWFGYNNVAWCGIFISWCANQAGIPTSVLQKNGIAVLEYFGITDTFTYASGRVPQPGDLFARQGDHVGIVYKVDVANNSLVTIEGNTNDSGWDGVGVFIRYHSLNDTRYTFGSPNYTSDHTHNYGQLLNEDAHPHKEYKVCTICSNKLFTGNTKTVASCTTCIQENCSHSFDSWANHNGDNHRHTCSLCQKTEYIGHSWNSGVINKVATCKEAGSKTQSCTVCGAQRTVTLDKLQTHTFTAWEKKDEKAHSRKCTVCEKVEEKEHTCPEEWSVDENQHWMECADCRELVNLGAHDFEDSCINPCKICQYLRPEGHSLHETWDSNENGHYHGCEHCPTQTDYAPHSYSLTLEGDETGHYYPCTVCGHKSELVAHTPGPEATEQEAQTCTVCDFVIAEALPHIHDFAPLEHNAEGHWGLCDCGTAFGPEEHQWNIATKTCSICAVQMPVTEKPFPWFWVSLAGGGVLLLGSVTFLTVLLVRKRKKKKVLQPV